MRVFEWSDQKKHADQYAKLFIPRRGQTQAWVDNNNRYGEGKT